MQAMLRKHLPLVIAAIITSSCLQGKITVEKDTTLIVRNENPSSCSDYFFVSTQLESDPHYNQILSEYLYACLVDVFDCSIDEIGLSELFVRDSFKKVVLLLYTDDRYYQLSHFETLSRWIERYDNLLFRCSNSDVVHSIANSLLAIDNPAGLKALWLNANIDQLTWLATYQKKVIAAGNPYKISELTILYHNWDYNTIRDSLLNELKNYSGFKNELKVIETMIKDSEKIELSKYIEQVFGGF